MKKVCSQCKEEKDVRLFGRRRRANRIEIRSQCKDCIRGYNLRTKSRRRKHWRKFNETLRGKYTHFKQTSKKRKLTWRLSFSEFSQIPQICYYTGIPLTLKRNHLNTLSLDRVNNKRGYTRKNVVFCCSAVNYMKSNLTLGDFISLCRKVSDHFS